MRIQLGLISLLALAGCLDSGPQVDETKVSTIDQEVQSCMSSCDRPTYNGVPVSCTSNIVCVSQSNGVGCLNDDQTTVTIVYCSSEPVGCTYPQSDCCGDGYCHNPTVCDHLGCF